MKAKKIIFKDAKNLFVVTKSQTSNNKLTPYKEPIVQTYTFSLDQFNLVKSGVKFTMNNFFTLDKNNCLDCPYSKNSGSGECYTHKFNQYMGFLSSLRSIIKRDMEIKALNESTFNDIVDLCKDTFVRFGAYGEPVLMPFKLVQAMANNASKYTGYTHQYRRKLTHKFSAYFMASTHGINDINIAEKIGFRAFDSQLKNNNIKAVICPASKESNYKSNCVTCGLCSGTLGKGKKNVKILIH
jgi:hypothetical protein